MDTDLTLLKTIFTDKEIKVNDKIIYNNKLYILYNKLQDINTYSIYLTIIDLQNYRILKNFKYPGISSCFSDEYYAILYDYKTIKIYKNNNYKLNNTIILEYNFFLNNSGKYLKYENIEKKISNVTLLNINNVIYICNIYSKLYSNYEIMILNTIKRTSYEFLLEISPKFYKGNNSIIIAKSDYMINYNVDNNTTHDEYYKYFNLNIYGIKHYGYRLKNDLSENLFLYHEGYYTKPIKISNTEFLYDNFTYNTLTKEYKLMNLEIQDNFYLLDIKDYININFSNMINNYSFVDMNTIYVYKLSFDNNDFEFIKNNKMIMDNDFQNIDLNIFNGDLKDVYYQMLLNNIIIKLSSKILSDDSYNNLFSKILDKKDIIEYIFTNKLILD